MTRSLLIIFLLCFIMAPVYSQPNNEAVVKTEAPQKLFLPAIVIDDPDALAKAIPQIASQSMAVLKLKGPAYFRLASTYSLLTGDYKKAADFIDSVRKVEGDQAFRIYFKLYSEAKLRDNSEGKLFTDYFQKEFSAAFKTFSFSQKYDVSGIDSSYIADMNKNYKSVMDELKKDRSDSITLEDAKELCKYYAGWLVYNKVFPLSIPYTSDPKYKKSFPAIKGNSWGGVVPVEGIDAIPDPKLKYKFVMELTSFGMPKEPDSVSSKDINLAIRSIARTINLHVGAGIPKENIDIVLAVHGSALNAFFNDQKYKKKYGVDNPNIPLLKELQDFGVKVILCGQAMHYQKNVREDFIPGIKVALTAQTVISEYQLKKYVFSDLSLRE